MRDRIVLLVGLTTATIVSGSMLSCATVDPNVLSASSNNEAIESPGPRTKWIVEGDVSSQTSADAPSNITHNAPRGVENDAKARILASLIGPLVPADSKPQSLIYYPDLNAATASFATSDGNVITFNAQRMTQPVSLNAITLGSPLSTLSELPTGLQVVEIRNRMPRAFQVVLVRPSGVMLTIILVSATPGARIAHIRTPAPDAFASAAAKTFDVAATDGLFR